MTQGFTSFLSGALARSGPIVFAGILALGMTAVTTEAALANPFTKLAGYWSGGGTVSPTNGQPEKVSCRVTYQVKGNSVTQNMRCAGTDYKFATSSDLTYSGGSIKGSWSESTYDANGSVVGTGNDSAIHARISGDKFSGRMAISISGNRHTINITQLDPRTGRYAQVARVTLGR